MAYQTFLQLYTDALTQADELTGSGSAIARTIIKSGINESYSEIAAIRNWPQLENNGTITTVSGTNQYTPITSSATVPRIRRIESLLDETNNKYIIQLDRQIFEKKYPFIDTTSSGNQGAPRYWYETSYANSRDIQIKTFPVPNSALTLRAFWYEEPLPLLADGDIPRIPDQFHYGLNYLGLAKYFEFQKDFISLVYRNLHNEFKTKILQDEYGYTDKMPQMEPVTRDQNFVTGKIGRVWNN